MSELCKPVYRITTKGKKFLDEYKNNEDRTQNALQQILTLSQGNLMCRADYIHDFNLPIPASSQKAQETRELFNYIIENIDDLLEKAVKNKYMEAVL